MHYHTRMSKTSSTTPAVRTRFAPSPTGDLHLGNARTALFCWLLAHREGGQFVLRAEDTDAQRSTEASLRSLQGDLQWLQMPLDEGPGEGGAHGPYRQSERSEIYAEHYDALQAQGRAYPCFCSPQKLKRARARLRAAGKPPRYPGTCRGLDAREVQARLDAGEQASLRYAVAVGESVMFDDFVRGEQHFSSDDIGDFIIRRSDGTPAFFFSNAIDDAMMGITHVLRGEDHLTNTPRQLMLLNALGLAAPRYGHVSLLVGDDGAPLSKRHGSASVGLVREEGYLPLALNNHLARLGCHYPDSQFMGMDALAQAFDLARLGRAPARHDPAQLEHWQREALAAASDEGLLAWLQAALGPALGPVGEARATAFVGLIRENILLPPDAAKWAVQLCETPAPGAAAHEAMAQAGSAFFDHALAILADQQVGDTAPEYKPFTKALGKAAEVRGKGLFMPLRAALTGETGGPELVRLWGFLGTEQIRQRLQATRDRLAGS